MPLNPSIVSRGWQAESGRLCQELGLTLDFVG